MRLPLARLLAFYLVFASGWSAMADTNAVESITGGTLTRGQTYEIPVYFNFSGVPNNNNPGNPLQAFDLVLAPSYTASFAIANNFASLDSAFTGSSFDSQGTWNTVSSSATGHIDGGESSDPIANPSAMGNMHLLDLAVTVNPNAPLGPTSLSLTGLNAGYFNIDYPVGLTTGNGNFTIVAPAPEPSSMGLLGAGSACLIAFVFFKSRAADRLRKQARGNVLAICKEEVCCATRLAA